jgi:hypothetical protein
MILIYPPVAKSSEPPAGVAKLSGALKHCGIEHSVIDANLEGQLWLMQNGHNGHSGLSDTWSVRSHRNIHDNLNALRKMSSYNSIDRYSRAVLDVNRVLLSSARASDNEVTMGIANYRHEKLSPLRSRDLISAAERPRDNPFYSYFSARISKTVETRHPKVVGISVNYLSQALSAFAIAGFVRMQYPDIRIIMGGGLVTSWLRGSDWQGNLFGGLVDHLVAGPGERYLLSILGIDMPGKEHISPDCSAFPLNEYLSPGGILPYSGSSGCWWAKCSFCPESSEGNPYIKISASSVSADLHSLVRATRPALVHLLDNSLSPDLLDELIKNPPGVPWYGFARANPDLGDDDYCAMLKRSGCVMLKLGLESGNQKVLDSMQKGIDLQTASNALKALKKAGISTYVYLLFGTPPESYKEAVSTLEFISRHADAIGFLNLAIFNMPACGPGTTGLRTSSFYEGDLSLYSDFEHPLGWDRKSVRRFLDEEFKKDRDVSLILKRTPPIFTSNHAAFFV